MIILKDAEIVGRSHRFGLLLSIEKAGVFFIIYWNRVRRWVGIGKRPSYLDKYR